MTCSIAGRRSAAAMAALTVLVLGCSSERASEAGTGRGVRGGVGVVCAQAAPESLNPFVSPDASAADLRLVLFSPLVLYDAPGTFRPYLATEWRWEEGDRRVVFRIRSDVTWHDGTPLTAEDVAWTLRAAADPAYAYWNAADFSALEDAIARDSVTVEVRFAKPFAAGLEPFVALPILPRHLLGEIAPAQFRDAEYHRAPVGSGPFRFAGRAPDGSIRFDRAPAFPEELGRARLDRIVLRPIPEASTLLVELETRSVDLCVTGVSLAQKMEESGRLELWTIEPASVLVLPLNVRHRPFDDARVRRALSATLRRSEIAGVISPRARPARTFLPEASPWIDPALQQPDNDSALAASLLASAGWSTNGSDGVRRNAAGQPLRLTLMGPTTFETFLTVIQAQLRRVGVGVDLRLMEGAAYIAAIRNPASRPDAMALALKPEKFVHPDVFHQFHSTGGSNLSGYQDREVDAWVERLQTARTDAERATLYRELQRKIAGEVPTIYAVYLPRVAAAGPQLRGVRVDLNGPFTSVAEWWKAAP